MSLKSKSKTERPNSKSSSEKLKSNKSSELSSLSSENSTLGLDTSGFDRSSFVNTRLNDLIQLVFHCTVHNKILLTRFNNTLYFPFMLLRPGETVCYSLLNRTKDYCKQLGIERPMLADPILVDLWHIQIPPQREFICRFTFLIELKSSEQCLCSLTPKNCFWQLVDDFKTKLVPSLWGPEPVLLLENIFSNNREQSVLQEITLESICKYLHETLRKDNNPLTSAMLKMGLKEMELYQIFVDYLSNTYPSIYMTRYSLQDFMIKSGLFNFVYQADKLLSAFQIDPNKDPSLVYIDFDEFLYGLVMMDLDCPHVSPYSTIRSSYVFRYYSHTKASIEYDELMQLCRDVEVAYIRNVMGLSVNQLRQQHEEEVNKFLSSEGDQRQDKTSNSLTFAKFAAKVEQAPSKYFNIDNTWRLLKPVSYHYQHHDVFNRANSGKNLSVDLVHRRGEFICQYCKRKGGPRISEHSVKTYYNGTITEVLDNEKWVDERKRAVRMLRNYSNMFFSDDYFPNILIDAIGELADEQNDNPSLRSRSKHIMDKNAQANNSATNKTSEKKTSRSKQSKWLMKLTPNSVQQVSPANFSKIFDLCVEVENLLRENIDIVWLQSPCVLLHEFQGKTLDLFTIERNVSQLASFCYPIKYVYLVNWNNLATNGLHLILFWMANKVLLPDKYHLLLWNRTDQYRQRDNSVNASLIKQCESFFGKEQSIQLWPVLTRILANLSRMVMVDQSVSVISSIDNGAGQLAPTVDQTLSTIIKEYNENVKSQTGQCECNLRSRYRTRPLFDSKKQKQQPRSIEDQIRYIVFTTTNEVNGKNEIFTKSFDKSTAPAGGRDTIDSNNVVRLASSSTKQPSVVMIEAEKIRTIYLN